MIQMCFQVKRIDASASLLIVHVEEPPIAYGGGEMYYGAPNPATEDLRQMLAKVTPPDPEVPCRFRERSSRLDPVIDAGAVPGAT